VLAHPCPNEPGRSCATTIVSLPATGTSPAVLRLFELSGAAVALGLVLMELSRLRWLDERRRPSGRSAAEDPETLGLCRISVNDLDRHPRPLAAC
jgi:hypothetical protein